jgi:Holliday junction DNA helicase RuvA
MIEFIEGRVVSKEGQKVVIDTGGIGFGLLVSSQTLSNLPPQGSMAMVYANLQVREDGLSLYGFLDRDERGFFELLIQVSGVGPKLALAVLSSFPVHTVKKAIVMGDIAALSVIPGIGKKMAQRIVLELKDKLDKEMLFDNSGNEGFLPAADSGAREEVAQAVEALEALGYGRADIIKVFAGKELGDMDIEGMIRMGLKALARF